MKEFLERTELRFSFQRSKGSRVLEVTEGRERASAERLFESVALEQRENVEAVVMDMTRLSKRHPKPRCLRQKSFMTASMLPSISTKRSIRCAAPSIASFRGRRRDLKGSKFLFLFAPENLDSERRARLRDLLNSDLKVGRAWTLKEQFRHFWERANARTL